MSLKRITNVAGITIVACIVAAACGTTVRPAGSQKKLVPATIFIFGSDPAACKAKVSPYTMQPKQNEWAHWTIIDTCGVTATKDIELRWLASNPDCDGKKTPLVGEARGKTTITLEVNKCKALDVFGYEVWTADPGGQKLADPELEIAM